MLFDIKQKKWRPHGEGVAVCVSLCVQSAASPQYFRRLFERPSGCHPSSIRLPFYRLVSPPNDHFDQPPLSPSPTDTPSVSLSSWTFASRTDCRGPSPTPRPSQTLRPRLFNHLPPLPPTSSIPLISPSVPRPPPPPPRAT